ncbi:hypothetical protein [Enterococcus gallinarum]|jgi:hypothetical protein|uniref:hypothetical protein n=1 Tax=Enterococcus gallinarum TaxID=1353 RepID=UPI00280396AA|nr:hypothetical protein [Enterococcus gallinarum]MDT2685818.1 hypothetical protein [Enterococcus gallinarum]
MGKQKRGRPKKITDEVLQKLEQGFLFGFTDEEACLHADIGTSTLYSYCQENPEFSERKEQLKNRPKMRAKINIAKTMEKGDVELSKWYLERKARDEFGNNQKIEHSGVDGEPLTLEIKL